MLNDKEGNVIYGCPIIETEETTTVDEQWKSRKLRFKPCPVKLAREYNHNLGETLQAIQCFSKQGLGRYMTEEDLNDFLDMAADMCRLEGIWSEDTTSIRQKEEDLEADKRRDIWSL
jgi:hypothetical protein